MFKHLSAGEITTLHDQIVLHSGGLAGCRPDLSIDAVLGRIHDHINYGNLTQLHDIAALYASAIACGHVFLDGNKRTAEISMLSIIALNGSTLEYTQAELADKMVLIASNAITPFELAVWIMGRLS